MVTARIDNMDIPTPAAAVDVDLISTEIEKGSDHPTATDLTRLATATDSVCLAIERKTERHLVAPKINEMNPSWAAAVTKIQENSIDRKENGKTVLMEQHLGHQVDTERRYKIHSTRLPREG